VQLRIARQSGSSLKRIAIAIEVCALAWLIRNEDLDWVSPTLLTAMGAVACVALMFTAWPVGATVLLIAGSAAPRFVWSAGNFHFHAEHVAILAGIVAIMIKRGYRGVRRGDIYLFDWFLIAYVGLNFFSSAFTSPEPHNTLRWATLQTSVIVCFFLLRFLVRTRDILWKAWLALLVAGAAGSLYGCVAFLSNRLFRTTFGVEAEQYGGLPGTYGTQYEANIFGSYAACVAVMFLAGFLMSRAANRKWWIAGFLVGSFALVVSMSRAVLLSFPVAALFAFWMTAKAQHLDTKRMVKITLTAAATLLLATPFLLPMLRERFDKLTDISALTEDETTVERLIQMKVAADNIRDHPVFGTGTASFQLFFNWQQYVPEMGDMSGWLGNTPMRILNDTGVIGLTVFLCFLGSLGRRLRKILHYSDHRTRTVLVALACGIFLYAMTFQSTEATMLAFPWIHLGLLASGVVIVERESLQPIF